MTIVTAAVALRLMGLDGDLADHDSWRQCETATIARNFLDEPRLLWPRINWGVPGPGYVEAEFQLFPYVVHLIYRVLGENPLYGRVLSVLLFALSCWPFHRIARRLLTPRWALAAVAVYALSPVVFRYTRAFMPESTALLFALLALERYVAFLDSNRTWSLLASAASMAIAILVKPTSIHLGLALIVLVWSRFGWRFLVQARMWGFAAIALLPTVAYYWHAARIHANYGNTFGVISGGDSKWGGPQYWFDAAFYVSIVKTEALWLAGPVGFALALVGLLSRRERNTKVACGPQRATIWRPLVWGWGLATAIYYLIVARYCSRPVLGLQYHIYAAPLAALLAQKPLERLAEKGLAARRVATALFVLTLGWCIAEDLYVLRKREPLRLEAGRALAAVSCPTDHVLVLSSASLRDRGEINNYEEPVVLFHARRRGKVLPFDRQSAAGIGAHLLPTIRWFVNFPELNRFAAVDFLPFLHEHMRLAISASGYDIYEILPH